MSIDKKRNITIGVFSYNGILHSNKEKWTTDASYKYKNIEWKKTKIEHSVFIYIYFKDSQTNLWWQMWK